MIKKILIGSGIALGVVGVITGTVVGVVVSNKKNNTNSEVKPEDKPNVPTDKPTTPEKPENKPDVPTDKPEDKPNAEQEQAKQAFIEALNASTFVKPSKAIFNGPTGQQNFQVLINLPANNTQENVSIEFIEQEIVEALQYPWSSSVALDFITINKVGTEYVVSLDKKDVNIDAYTKNIFGKTWADIMKESTNTDFQNINKVDYGFKLEIAKDRKTAKLIPTYTKVSFAQKPSWSSNNLTEANVTVDLTKNTSLVLNDIKLIFKNK